MLDRVSSKEMAGWRAFDAVEPIGAWRNDYNSAMLCCLYANANRRKGAPSYKPQDFMPFLPQPEVDHAEELLNIFKSISNPE